MKTRIVILKSELLRHRLVSHRKVWFRSHRIAVRLSKVCPVKPIRRFAWWSQFKGLPGEAKLKINCSELVNRIDKILERRNMSLLVTSPSFTSKTALANLTFDHWNINGKDVVYILIGNLYWTKKQSYVTREDLKAHLQEKLKCSMDDVMNTEGYLISDETQNIYHLDALWMYLKSGIQVRNVLAFAVFGVYHAGHILTLTSSIHNEMVLILWRY